MSETKDEIRIDTINITLGKKEINLTLEQAKKLKSLLEDLFGKEVIKEIRHDWYWSPKRYEPVIWGNNVCTSDSAKITPDWRRGEIMCSAKDNSLNISYQ